MLPTQFASSVWHEKEEFTYRLFSPLTRIHTPSDVLGKSLADLQKQFSEILARSQWERQEAQVRERKLQEEMALQQEKLVNGQEEFRHACERALEARVRKGPEAAGGKRLANTPVFQQITVLPSSRKYSIITVIFTLNQSDGVRLKFSPEYGY